VEPAQAAGAAAGWQTQWVDLGEGLGLQREGITHRLERISPSFTGKTDANG